MSCSEMTYLRKSETRGHVRGMGRRKRRDLVSIRLVTTLICGQDCELIC